MAGIGNAGHRTAEHGRLPDMGSGGWADVAFGPLFAASAAVHTAQPRLSVDEGTRGHGRGPSRSGGGSGSRGRPGPAGAASPRRAPAARRALMVFPLHRLERDDAQYQPLFDFD